MPLPRVPGAFAAGLVLWLLGGAAPAPARAFDLDEVAARARKLAGEPYQEPSRVPRWLLDIDYDRWRQIRFRPEQALWRGRELPFEVQFFHPGLYYDRTVRIHVVDAEGVRPARFSPDQYDYGGSELASRIPQDLGHAGFRLHAPFKTPDYYDEVAVFLGASYFRAVGRSEAWGLSARGLAIDTALPSGEEFPWFREFWLVHPGREAKELVLYALLDSRSVAGAYRFVVTPGQETVVRVQARLFRRRPVQKLGVAPLTSMFFYGETRRRGFEDFRPEVHDSDGLQVLLDSGERIWRPLANPETLRVTSFEATHPRGFGLAQRDRNWDHYQDLETRPDLRPDLWVVPEGDWGPGRVELVEIPSDSEHNDNIVAYWVPERLPPLEKPIVFAYRTHWRGAESTGTPSGGRVVATRLDAGDDEGTARWIVDFEGGELDRLEPESTVRGVVSVGPAEAGELVEQRVERNPVTGGWRLVFDVRPSGSGPLDLRAFLQRGEEALTETWTTVMEP